MKNNKKIVLKVNMKKLTLKIAELTSISVIDMIYQISKGYIHYTFGQQQKPTKNPTKACFEQFLVKKEKNNGFPGLT